MAVQVYDAVVVGVLALVACVLAVGAAMAGPEGPRWLLASGSVASAAAAVAFGVMHLMGASINDSPFAKDAAAPEALSCPPFTTGASQNECLPTLQVGDQMYINQTTGFPPGGFVVSALEAIPTKAAKCAYLKTNALAWPDAENACADA